MKKNRIFLCTLCSALAALMLVACSQGKDYREVIPADAFMVFSANPKSLAHKAQIGDFTKSPIYAQIEQAMAKDNEMTPESREYVLSLIADPAKAGLSMDHDCFLFMQTRNIAANDMNVGIVYKVKDRKAIDNMCEWMITQGASIEKIDAEGLTVYTDGGNGSHVALAYDDNVFVAYVSPMNPTAGTEALKTLFTQKKDQSIMGNQHAATILDGSNDASMFISYSSIWPMVEQQMGGIGMAGMEWLGKMSIAMPVNFEKGRIVSDAKIFFDDADAEKQYREMAEANMTFNGDLLKYLPEGSMAVFGGAMNGAKTYELFQKIPMYSMVLAMVPQAKTIFDAIEGDLVLSFNTMSAGGRFPEATIMAKVNDPNMLETVRGLMAMGNLPHRDIAPGQYEGTIEGIPYWFGVKDGVFYATSDFRTIALMNDGGASMHNKYGNLFNGFGGFAIDFNALHSMLQRLIAEGVIPAQVGMALPYVALFEDMYSTATSQTEVSIVTNMTDKEKNAADVLYHAIEQLVVMIIGMN